MRSLDGSNLGLFLRDAFGEEVVEFCFLLLLALELAALEGVEVTPALETDGCDQTLDFWRLGIRLCVLLLRTLHLSPDNILPDIILLPQVEKASNLRRPLRAQSLREDIIRQSGDVALALLDDNEGEDGDVGPDDAATDGLALALAGAAGPEVGVAVGEEELDAVGEEDTLFHGEALFVVTAGDAEDVAFPFGADGVCGDLLRYFLVVEDAVALFVIDVD